MAALLWPERMVDQLLSVVERDASKPLPVIERPARIAALNREIEQLRRLEEALVAQAIENGEIVTRSVDAPPWAVLGVTVATNKAVKRMRVAS